MKKMKKDKKGFTLVEVLVTIVVLGIISVIAIAGVQTVMNNSRVKYYKSLRDMIISAAKEYYSDNKTELPVDIDESTDPLYITTLIDSDYIDTVKDANGDVCQNDESFVIAKKEDAREYSYTLNLKCKDPKMPKVVNDATTPKSGNISVKCNITNSGKKARAYLTLDGRSDYRYEVLKREKDESKYKLVNNKKGNIKDGSNRVEIPINYGSGDYRVRATTGNGQYVETECTVDAPVPDCDGIDYKLSHVAKEWFRGTLKVTIESDKEKAKKYYIDKFKLQYEQIDSTGKDESTGKKDISSAFSGFENTYNFEVSRGRLSVFIYNDVGDEKECKLGEYWMDNKAPTCTNQQVNEVWTNSPSAKAVTDCDDDDVENGEKSVRQSGCMEDQYEDPTEDEYTDFNFAGAGDEFYIQDKVGNVATGDSNCRFLKRIDRTAPRCDSVSKYGQTEWGQDFKAWATCIDDQKPDVTPSQCTEARVEEGEPDGETKTFTVKDNAGNTTDCLADKHRDNVPPVCTGSTFSDWTNSSSARAYADCEDSNGEGRSGCKESKVMEKEISDGESIDIEVEDYAANKSTCSAEKKRDRVKPTCVSFTTEEKTEDKTCTSTWTSTTTLPSESPDLPPKIEYKQESFSTDFVGSCWLESSVSCQDDLSGCTDGPFESSTTHRSGSGPTSCSGQGCCNNVQSADCSGDDPKSIEIKDNAGNTTTCGGDYDAEKPDDPEKDNTATCGDLTISPMGSSSVQWLIQDSVDVSVTWDSSKNISVSYQPGNEFSGTASGGNGSMTIHFGQGAFEDGKLIVSGGDGGQSECDLGSYYIDNVPPEWQEGMSYSVRGDNGLIKCSDQAMSNRQKVSSANLTMTANINNVVFKDDISGVDKIEFRFAPTIDDNDGYTVNQHKDNYICDTQNFPDHPGLNPGASANCSKSFTVPDISHTFCFIYSIALKATDAAGNISKDDADAWGNDFTGGQTPRGDGPYVP